MAKLDNTHVTLETANETYKLVYNGKALRRVSQNFGGYQEALRQVAQLNYDTIRFLIVTGADLEKKAARELDDEIIETGLSDVADAVAKYVTLLFTGKHPDYDDLGDEAEDEQGNGKSRGASTSS